VNSTVAVTIAHFSDAPVPFPDNSNRDGTSPSIALRKHRSCRTAAEQSDEKDSKSPPQVFLDGPFCPFCSISTK
jgi:hypothetical protein